MSATELVVLLLAEAMQWPQVVRRWAVIGQKLLTTTEGPAEQMMEEALCQIITEASGQKWPITFKRMLANPRMNAVTGLTSMARQLGLVTDATHEGASSREVLSPQPHAASRETSSSRPHAASRPRAASAEPCATSRHRAASWLRAAPESEPLPTTALANQLLKKRRIRQKSPQPLGTPQHEAEHLPFASCEPPCRSDKLPHPDQTPLYSENIGAVDARVVKLGPALHAYTLHPNPGTRALLADILAKAQVFTEGDLSWPATPAEIPTFLQRLLDFALAVRSTKVVIGEVRVGLSGGTEKHSFLARHFVRNMLLMLEKMSPETVGSWLDPLPYCDLVPWLPDVTEQCEPLHNLSGQQLRQMFEISPLMISCWACLVHVSLTSQQQSRLLSATDNDLFPLVDMWFEELEHTKSRNLDPFSVDLFPPGPKDILDEN